MKIIITLIILLMFSLANASGHLSKKDKEATTKCTGIYYANSMITQDKLELNKIVHSFAAKKFLSDYLIKEGVNEDALNKELNKSVDALYGKPYDSEATTKCDEYIFKLIPESKEEIDKIIRSGVY
tara:strand:+ start:354 stop:731 length:378 start_codon:yes stop_codon:yes gene_type:complete